MPKSVNPPADSSHSWTRQMRSFSEARRQMLVTLGSNQRLLKMIRNRPPGLRVRAHFLEDLHRPGQIVHRDHVDHRVKALGGKTAAPGSLFRS